MERAQADGLRSAITISVAFGCPFEGRVDEERVLELAAEVASARPDALLLADTIGVAVPRQVTSLVARTGELGLPVGGHFHNTRSTGYANALAALDSGATILDASIGGLGGCPFAPNATGNIATEDLVYLLDGEGIETGVDLAALVARLGVARGPARPPARGPGVPGRAVPGRLISRAPEGSSRGPRRARCRPRGRGGRPRPRPRGTSARSRRPSLIGCAPFDVSSMSEPSLPCSGPEIVPDAKRSPVRSDAPLTVACASCCGIVQ